MSESSNFLDQDLYTKKPPLILQKVQPINQNNNDNFLNHDTHLSNYQTEYDEVIITDVWADNLDQEMKYIYRLIEECPYIAMDTEFPGVVAKPLGNFRSTSEYHFQALRCNVNLLKIIQLGLTFSDKDGNLPKNRRATWQFHFKFNLKEDMYAQDSIELLTNSGIDFEKHMKNGIDVFEFGGKLISSGIVLSEEVRWISFHSAYDFGYLIKLLTNNDLPQSEKEFFELLHVYFPYIYDIKYLMKSCENLKGGLNQLADDLNVPRIGPAHQAGSDSLLTLQTFFRMMKLFFESKYDDKRYLGILYGLGVGSDNNITYTSSVVNETELQNDMITYVPSGDTANTGTVFYNNTANKDNAENSGYTQYSIGPLSF